MVTDPRVVIRNERPEDPHGAYVLYWMTSQRRTRCNPALARAVDHAARLGRPLLVMEGLRAGYPWAAVRHHRFVIEGMRDNARRCAEAGVTYLPFVEPAPGAHRGLLAALAAPACRVVADAWTHGWQRRMVDAAAGRLDVALEGVDGIGVLPLGVTSRAFPTAAGFRRHAQALLPAFLARPPEEEPLGRARGAAVPPEEVLARWPTADLDALLAPGGLAALPIDHEVPPVPFSGGSRAGDAALAAFLDRLDRYATDRNEPGRAGTSGLSPYLHHGHVGAADLVRAVLAREAWTPDRLGTRPSGSREGWWGASPGAEAFLDQLVTWRELAATACAAAPHDAEAWRHVPAWARETLDAHAADPRDVVPFDALEAAASPDPLWNAAQRQLRVEGRIHGYLRMVWGKRMLEWTATPEGAFARLLALNDRWAVDGRDAASIASIGWIFGRFDRPWGPRRPVFGLVRYMSSANTARKLDLAAYLRRWGA